MRVVASSASLLLLLVDLAEAAEPALDVGPESGELVADCVHDVPLRLDVSAPGDGSGVDGLSSS